MMGHVLKVGGFTHIETDAAGIVTYRKRYAKGDSLDDLPKAHLDRLLSLDAAVDPDAAPDDPEEEGTPEGTPESPEGQDEAQEGQDDGLDDTSYPDLQQAAKSRGLSAAGSADDLRERIREFDAADDDA